MKDALKRTLLNKAALKRDRKPQKRPKGTGLEHGTLIVLSDREYVVQANGSWRKQ